MDVDYKESWALKNWCFWTVVLEKTWIAWRSNQSILKISPGYWLEGLMLKLELQYFGSLMRRADSFEKTLILGKIEGGRRRAQWRIRWLDGITDIMDMGLGGLWGWWWTGKPGMLQFMGLQRVGHDWVTELNWTEHGKLEQINFLIVKLDPLILCTVWAHTFSTSVPWDFSKGWIGFEAVTRDIWTHYWK